MLSASGLCEQAGTVGQDRRVDTRRSPKPHLRPCENGRSAMQQRQLRFLPKHLPEQYSRRTKDHQKIRPDGSPLQIGKVDRHFFG